MTEVSHGDAEDWDLVKLRRSEESRQKSSKPKFIWGSVTAKSVQVIEFLIAGVRNRNPFNKTVVHVESPLYHAVGMA